jgi:type-F conjugative transfer system pilin assembly protein TrbC
MIVKRAMFFCMSLSVCCFSGELERLMENEKENIIADASTWAASVSLEKVKPSKCFSHFSDVTLDVEADSRILIFMSFSVPDAAWVTLSKQLEKHEGAFVLRGIPDNDFLAFSDKVMRLKERGVEADIQIDPKQFERFDISLVPSFIFPKEEGFDKVTGNISLNYALELVKEGGL